VIKVINHKSRNIIFLIITTFIILFGISSVSAANNNTYVNVQGNNSWDGSTPTHTNATNGPKQTIASGLSVTNNRGNISIAAGTYKENKLIISKNLTISGASKTNTIINAMGSNLIFWIQLGNTVTIKNLNITNGTASKTDFSRNGGGIYNQGTLIIDNCIFYSNRAGDAPDAGGAFGDNSPAAGNGGAIYNAGSLTVTNSEFYNNHAGQGGDSSGTHKGSAGGNGGAIYNLGLIPNIEGCTFRNNYAGKGGKASDTHDGHSGGSGGAIYNPGTINNIQSCVFTGNYAGNGGSLPTTSSANPGKGGSGGAIYSSNRVTVNNSTFNDNYAGNGGEGTNFNKGADGGSGGAIYNTGIFTTTNCNMQNNTAGDGGAGYMLVYGGYGGSGGAIWNSGTFTITNCEIQKNTGGTGGKGYGYEDLNTFDGENGNGGGIYNSATLTINNSKIHDNTAQDGGGIYNTGNINVTNTPFTKNTAQYRIVYYFTQIVLSLYGGGGGAIWNNGILTMMNITFTNNTAMYGGAIYYTGTRTYNVTNCSFINNNATAVDDHGKPIQVVTYSIPGGWKTFVSATIKSISKTMLISKISPVQGITSIVGDIVGAVKMVDSKSDAVEAAGGAIYMIKSVSLTVNNCPFINNTASLGGGICNFGNGSLNITNNTFTGNAAGVGGAVYCNDLGPLNATNNIFSGNCADGGAAIGYTGSSSSQWGTLTVKENIFRNNDASLGGAIYDNFQGNTKIHMNFNRIYGTDNYDVYNEVGKVDARFNWWNSNNGPDVYATNNCNIIVEPYMVLTINSPDLYTGDNSIINFNMLYDNEGTRHIPENGIIPDGIPVSLNVTSGTINHNTVTLINGTASTTYTANGDTGPVTISAIIDSDVQYPINSTFTVFKIPTNTYLFPTRNVAGQNVTLVARVSDVNDHNINVGYVKFNIGTASAVLAPVINGFAEYYWTIPLEWPPGNYKITANYTGTPKYDSSIENGLLTVDSAIPGSSSITVYPPVNGTQGQSVNLQARLIDSYKQPLANKNVDFILNGNNIGTAITDLNGVANLLYTILLAPGSYTILASFAADSHNSGSSNTGMLNVLPSPTGVSHLTITRKVQSIIHLGEKFVITIKIGNKGPDIAKNVVIKFTIPKGIDFITASVDQGTWNYNKGTRVFTWNLGDVAVGDPYLYLTLKANKLGKYQLKHLLTTKTFDPNLIRNQMIPLSIVITTPGDNNGNNDNESPVNVEGKTIGMQKTGLPIAGLIIAILALFGGLASTKRK
jgi:autotransporter family porin